jgi:hypothetical protein
MNLAGFFDHPGSAGDRAQGAEHDREYSMRLQQNGLDVPPLSHYSLRPTRPGLVFGFTAFDPQTIRESVKRAALALHRR